MTSRPLAGEFTISVINRDDRATLTVPCMCFLPAPAFLQVERQSGALLFVLRPLARRCVSCFHDLLLFVHVCVLQTQ